MLNFFRRYQKFFYVVVTAVIIISFSFFGTYDALNQSVSTDPIAFTTVTGQEVTRSQLEHMVAFINTDEDDKRLLGGVWGPNFLNDGVIAKDFLETGLAQQVIAQFKEDFAQDLNSRLAKEKKFRPYTHPQAKFVSAEFVWGYFVPDMKAAYDRLLAQEDATADTAVDARVQLYVQERKFPAPTLRQVLRYQEGQYDWIRPDPRLDREDLSLFRYHTVDDWFGARFTHLAAQFVFNAAAIAEQKGYVVSEDEALVDLMRRSDRSFREQANNPYLDVTSNYEYFKEQLRRLRVTESQAVRLWQNVLLFRRWLQDVGHAAWVDSLSFDQFAAFANAGVQVEAYELPEALRLRDFNALQRFETYIAAVRADSTADPLLLPRTIKSGDSLRRTVPELVQKRYLVDLRQVNVQDLQTRISLKETWAWQTSDAGWSRLIERFPELSQLENSDEESRFAALDAFDPRSRAQADSLAREAILKERPEWIAEALAKSESRLLELPIRMAGGSLPLQGVEDRAALIKELDALDLKQEEPQLAQRTWDGVNYYSLHVLDRSPEFEVLTFAEADEDGVLNPLLTQSLLKQYEVLRESQPATYQKEEGEWKPLAEVRLAVAKERFKSVLDALAKDAPNGKGQPSELSPDLAASRRFLRYMEAIRKEADVGLDAYVYLPEPTKPAEKRLSQRLAASEQWKLWKNERSVYRSRSGGWGKVDLFDLAPQSWSPVVTPADGNIAFYLVLEQLDSKAAGGRTFHMDDAYDVLGKELQAAVAEKLLGDLQEQGALSLDYFHR